MSFTEALREVCNPYVDPETAKKFRQDVRHIVREQFYRAFTPDAPTTLQPFGALSAIREVLGYMATSTPDVTEAEGIRQGLGLYANTLGTVAVTEGRAYLAEELHDLSAPKRMISPGSPEDIAYEMLERESDNPGAINTIVNEITPRLPALSDIGYRIRATLPDTAAFEYRAGITRGTHAFTAVLAQIAFNEGEMNIH
jgi:hypothetical protein